MRLLDNSDDRWWEQSSEQGRWLASKVEMTRAPTGWMWVTERRQATSWFGPEHLERGRCQHTGLGKEYGWGLNGSRFS